MTIFLRRGVVFLSAVIIVTVVGLGVKLAAKTFTVQNIVVSGNYHLEDDHVIRSAEINEGDSLIDLSLQTVKERVKNNAWIRNVSIRKEFPDTVSIMIEESSPKVILSLKGEKLLVDERGEVLEKIDGEGTSFLPVINDIDPQKEADAFAEALKLVEVISEKGVIDGKESIEIGLEPYGLAMKIDGEVIKVGYENYSEKFDKWQVLEPEIRKREGDIKYVDLRFDDVIVKPLRKARK